MHKSDMAMLESIADRMIAEKAPPGWSGTVKAMKRHMPDDKAFALAWDGYKKGKKPHYKDDGSTVNGKKPEKKKKYQNEENMDDLEEAAKKMKPGQTMTFKTIDMGNNENKGVAISMEQDGTFTAVALSKSKGGFKTLAGAQKWLEKTHGKKLAGGIVEAKESDILYQNGNYWVIKEMMRNKRTGKKKPVFKTVSASKSGTHGEVRGTFDMSHMADGEKEGLKRAIAHADRLAKKDPRSFKENMELSESMTAYTPGGKPVKMSGLLYPSVQTGVMDPWSRVYGHWTTKDHDGHYGMQFTTTQYQSPETGHVYQVELTWGGGEYPDLFKTPHTYYFMVRKANGGIVSAMTKKFKKYEQAMDYWFKRWKAAKERWEKHGVKFENIDSNGEQQDDEFMTGADELQKAIAQKLGGMSCGDSVMSLIGTMYDAGDLPAAAYATAAGMSRAEQELSHSSAKAMNQMAPDVLAGAIVRGMRATSSPTIKSAAAWWKQQIGALDADRGGATHTVNNTGPKSAAAIQPSIDYMATEEMDARFDAAILPIGAGALSDPASCMMAPYPAQMSGEAGSVEHGVDRAAAQASIVGGSPQNLRPARASRSYPDLPGENRVSPGRYTAESFDLLPYEERVRMAEAYDRLMGGASDLSRDERVDAEAYKAMLAGAHSNPQGSGTPIATMSHPHPDRVVVNDLDTAFDAAAE